jgi:hypothetical protein
VRDSSGNNRSSNRNDNDPAQEEPGGDHKTTRVVKTLWPKQAGTIRLTRRFGDALVCVRYRHDATGLHRFTTVEVIVDEAPVSGLRVDRRIYGVHIGLHESELRARAIGQGARWDNHSKLWRMRGKAIKFLGLRERIRAG